MVGAPCLSGLVWSGRQLSAVGRSARVCDGGVEPAAVDDRSDVILQAEADISCRRRAA